jgi:hypothetical protein
MQMYLNLSPKGEADFDMFFRHLKPQGVADFTESALLPGT